MRLPTDNVCSSTLLQTQTPTSLRCRCVCHALHFCFYEESVQPQLRGSPSECIRLVLQDCDQLPHVRHPTTHLGSSVLLSSPKTSTHHYCCTVAHDVLSRSRVETEPTTVQPLHSKFLQRSFSRRHCRHGTSSTSMLHVSQAMSKTCPNLSLNGLNFWDVFATFEFNVNDAQLLVALWYHILMTCGQHVLRECSLCVTVARAFARYNVREKCFRQAVITSKHGDCIPSSPMDMQSVANFDTPPGLDSGCGLSLPLARTQCLHQFLNGRCINSCTRLRVRTHLALRTYTVSTPASERQTRQLVFFHSSFTRQHRHVSKFRGLRFIGLSGSNPISILTPLFPGFSVADVVANSRCTPFTRSNSILLPENSLSIIPPVLRNVMMFHTCPTEITDLSSPEFLGAIWKSPDTLTPSLVCKQIVVLPVVVN